MPIFIYSCEEGVMGNGCLIVCILFKDSSGIIQRQSVHCKYCSDRDQRWEWVRVIAKTVYLNSLWAVRRWFLDGLETVHIQLIHSWHQQHPNAPPPTLPLGLSHGIQLCGNSFSCVQSLICLKQRLDSPVLFLQMDHTSAWLIQSNISHPSNPGPF